jgi:hypothetical protein
MTEIIATTTTYHPGIFVVRLVNTIIGLIEAAFALRIVLELFAANPASEFIAWVYNVTGTLIGPFSGAFPSIPLGGGSVIDVVAILAMIVYAVIGWLVLQLLLFIFSAATRA